MNIATSHPSTNDSLSAAIVERTTLLIFEEFQYRRHELLSPLVMMMIYSP